MSEAEQSHGDHAAERGSGTLPAADRIGRSDDPEPTSFYNLVCASPDGMLVHREGRIVYANPRALGRLGFASVEDAVGRSVLDLVHPDDRATVIARTAEVVAGSVSPPREIRFLAQDGREDVAELTAVGVVFDGKPAVLAIARDISERRRLETQLAASERMASMGILAASVAHEINNPLAAITANLAFVREQIEHPAPSGDGTVAMLSEALAETADAAWRIAAIAAELRLPSRAEAEAVAPGCVRCAPRCAPARRKNEVRHRARTVLVLDPTPAVLANEGRLCHVFLNLIVNAAQAIPDGAADRNEIRVRTRTDAWGQAVVEVTDTGVGCHATCSIGSSSLFSRRSRPAAVPGSASRSAVASSTASAAPWRSRAPRDADRRSGFCCRRHSSDLPRRREDRGAADAIALIRAEHAADFVARSGVPVLQKPLNPAELRALVLEQLEGRTRPT